MNFWAEWRPCFFLVTPHGKVWTCRLCTAPEVSRLSSLCYQASLKVRACAFEPVRQLLFIAHFASSSLIRSIWKLRGLQHRQNIKALFNQLLTSTVPKKIINKEPFNPLQGWPRLEEISIQLFSYQHCKSQEEQDYLAEYGNICLRSVTRFDQKNSTDHEIGEFSTIADEFFVLALKWNVLYILSMFKYKQMKRITALLTWAVRKRLSNPNSLSLNT